MAIIVVLTIIFAVVAGIVGGLTVVNAAGSIGSRSNGRVKELQAALRESKATETVAVRALRRIADPTCGQPILEASNALDTINNLEIKEIS
jgi:hypothetical protein